MLLDPVFCLRCLSFNLLCGVFLFDGISLAIVDVEEIDDGMGSNSALLCSNDLCIALCVFSSMWSRLYTHAMLWRGLRKLFV